MSEQATLARPYAEAAFKRAKETGSVGRWSDSLAFVSAVVSNEQIADAMNNPKFGKANLADLMLAICQDQLDSEGVNFLKLLVSNSRLKLAGSIAEIYEQFKAEDEGYIDAEVSTPFPLSPEEEKNLSATLEKRLKKKVRLQVKEDKSLIGGVFIRAGDMVIDGTIKGQLQHMRKALQ